MHLLNYHNNKLHITYPVTENADVDKGFCSFKMSCHFIVAVQKTLMSVHALNVHTAQEHNKYYKDWK
jgi:hypothetical protein